jgi:glycosyltransferase involved in cell wall biosynthesis
VLISEDFLPIIRDWGVSSAKCHVIPNWAPIEHLPEVTKSNPWSSALGFDRDACLLYAGTLGLKHNPDLLLQLARRLSERGRARVVVVTEGPGASWLRRKKAELNVANLELHDFEPFETFPHVLGAADVLLAILSPDASMFSVPSKVLAYLCAGRPLLLAVPRDNLASRIVVQNEAGIVVPPENITDFVDAAVGLLDNPQLRMRLGHNARRYAEKTFDIGRISLQFENILIGL